MNQKIKKIIPCILFAVSSILHADNLPEIPAKSWQKHKEGVDSALLVCQKSKEHQQKLNLYIKNTSNEGVSIGEFKKAVSVYYVINSNNVPLYKEQASKPSELPSGFTGFGLTPPIKPGNVKIISMDLSEEQLVIVKNFPIGYDFYLYNKFTKKFHLVSTTPARLSIIPGNESPSEKK
jgi:hypothetical protein